MENGTRHRWVMFLAVVKREWLSAQRPFCPQTASVFGSACNKGDPLSSALLHTAQTALENPFIAALLGLLFAAGLMLASRSSFRRISAENAPAGLAFATLSLFGRLLLATLSLWAYKKFLTPGFKPFAFTLAGGFIVLYTVEVVRYSGMLKRHRPKSAR